MVKALILVKMSLEEIQLRSLVTSKDAGVIIGKNGTLISSIRDSSSTQISLSKVIPKVSERIVSVQGSLEHVVKVSVFNQAYHLITEALMKNNEAGVFTFRLLIAHQLAGSIIGKAGSKIQSIQETSGIKR